MSRKQIRFNDTQEKELEYWKALSKVKNDSEAVHLAVSYAIKYFDNVTQALDTKEFELAIMKKTKYYKPKGNERYRKIV